MPHRTDAAYLGRTRRGHRRCPGPECLATSCAICFQKANRLRPLHVRVAPGTVLTHESTCLHCFGFSFKGESKHSSWNFTREEQSMSDGPSPGQRNSSSAALKTRRAARWSFPFISPELPCHISRTVVPYLPSDCASSARSGSGLKQVKKSSWHPFYDHVATPTAVCARNGILWFRCSL